MVAEAVNVCGGGGASPARYGAAMSIWRALLHVPCPQPKPAGARLLLEAGVLGGAVGGCLFSLVGV